MRRITQQARFKDDLRRQLRRGRDIEDLVAVIEILAQEGSLPAGFRPHQLTGDWKGTWECHIDADWLLIYQVTSREVLLIRTGTHADLFW
jgi:mRNA interferase YafQ